MSKELYAGVIGALGNFGRVKAEYAADGTGVVFKIICPNNNVSFTNEEDLITKLKRAKEGYVKLGMLGISLKYTIIPGEWTKEDAKKSVNDTIRLASIYLIG